MIQPTRPPEVDILVSDQVTALRLAVANAHLLHEQYREDISPIEQKLLHDISMALTYYDYVSALKAEIERRSKPTKSIRQRLGL